MEYIIIKNNEAIPFSSIPVLDYKTFLKVNAIDLMQDVYSHCVNYFGYIHNDKLRLICCIANDNEHNIYVNSSEINLEQKFESFTKHNIAFEKFEREIHENFGIQYTDHPWLKPVRFPHSNSVENNLEFRIQNSKLIKDYPFFKINGEELHEVGVGPIHAGIIEPGHFRFICNGEQIMHLEIQLGYQHRGIEKLMSADKTLLQRTSVAESIAGDTVIGHTLAFVNLYESLFFQNVSNLENVKHLKIARTIALELERIAIHTGDLSALCTDIAYQLGSAVFGRLRTPLINFFSDMVRKSFCKRTHKSWFY